MIEQLYSDFTNKLLPQLQQGLTISKDYFVDLFGRYVNYLIVIDSITISIGLILIVIGIILGIKLKKWILDDELIAGYTFMLLFSVGIGLLMIVLNVDNLIKDIYIPEVRVFEILKDYK